MDEDKTGRRVKNVNGTAHRSGIKRAAIKPGASPAGAAPTNVSPKQIIDDFMAQQGQGARLPRLPATGARVASTFQDKTGRCPVKWMQP